MKEVGTSIPGTELKIVKQHPNDEDGISFLMQVKFVTEEEILLWGTSKIKKKLKRPLTQRDSFTQVTWVDYPLIISFS